MPTWFLTAGSTALAALWLLQTWLLGRKHLAGWVIAVLSCALTIPYDFFSHQYAYIVSASLGAGMSVRAFRAWRADGYQSVEVPLRRRSHSPD